MVYAQVLQVRAKSPLTYYCINMKKHNKIIKPAQLPTYLIQRLTAKYGPIDYKRDFLKANLKTYFKCTDYDDARKYTAHDVIKLE